MSRPLSFLALCLVLVACGAKLQPAQPSAPVAVQIFAPNFEEIDPAKDWAGPLPSTHAVHGIDISVWQGTIDWPTARRNGVNFAFMKATEGGDLVDPAFFTNWENANASGVVRGAYQFFYHCGGSATAQARWFINHVPRTANALPPVLYMQWTPYSPTCRTRRPTDQLRADARPTLRRSKATTASGRSFIPPSISSSRTSFGC
jgi:lysozyme